MTNLESVTISVGYGDFLRAAAPFNRPLLDRWIVVTVPQDCETRSVCREFSIECIVSEEHTRDGAFSKGRLIDRGFAMLRGDGWMMHLDADIVLPNDLHQVLEEAHLDERCIHGCDRLNVMGWDNWQKVQRSGLRCRSNPYLVELDRPHTTVGARVANTGSGYSPLGFMQLWSGKSSIWRDSHTRRYPVHHGSAARTDIQMGLQWDRRHRIHIPEMIVWHLESEPCPMGTNWNGRKTKRFGPECHPKPPKPYC